MAAATSLGVDEPDNLLPQMKCKWVLPANPPSTAFDWGHRLGLSPLLTSCLWNRGLSCDTDAQAFLQPRLRDLSDPFLLPDMESAVRRLLRARENAESIVIFGDYDVDGITATAILLEVLKPLGWTVSCYLPHRMEEGYGLSADGVANCLRKCPASLLLAVDCGSTAVSTIAELRRRGVDTIVLDHHQVSVPAPDAVSLVNPQRSTHPTRCRELCSAGLAFKLAHALIKRGRTIGLPGSEAYDVRPLLDLAALGTIADLVPLVGENRILTASGLRYLNHSKRPGLQALKSVAQITTTIGVYEVGFLLAPRLNAAGRLENAERALRLIQARTLEEAEPLARHLDAQNRERQQIERKMADDVIGAVRARFDDHSLAIVEGQLLWHVGVVGIVASRLVREFYRPAIVIGGEGEEWRGSGRSIEGFDLAAALNECRHLLIRHGGHAMAAGLSIDPANLEAFRTAFHEIARQRIRPDELTPRLKMDGETSLADLSLERLEELEQLKPHGIGNPEVQLAVRGVVQRGQPHCFGRDRKHMKLTLCDRTGSATAIHWNGADDCIPSGPVDLAVVPQINRYNGCRSVRLKVMDWQMPSQSSV